MRVSLARLSVDREASSRGVFHDKAQLASFRVRFGPPKEHNLHWIEQAKLLYLAFKSDFCTLSAERDHHGQPGRHEGGINLDHNS